MPRCISCVGRKKAVTFQSIRLLVVQGADKMTLLRYQIETAIGRFYFNKGPLMKIKLLALIIILGACANKRTHPPGHIEGNPHRWSRLGTHSLDQMDSSDRNLASGADQSAIVKARISSTKFINVLAGTFKMGSPPDEKNRRSNEQQHQVVLKKDFQMQATEVTQLQYLLVMGRNPSFFKTKQHCEEEHRAVNAKELITFHGEKIEVTLTDELCPSYPVERVSWNEVQVFISRLNERDHHYTYRLPTEVEWEYAARAGTTTAFNLGDKISRDKVNYKGNSYRRYKNSKKGVYRGQTVAVASLPNANDWGLYDMHGNVSEWIQDVYKKHLTYGPHATISKPPSVNSARLVRGGSWYDFTKSLRSAYRDNERPYERNNGIGLRLVRIASALSD